MQKGASKVNQHWSVARDQFLSKEEVQRLYSALQDAKDLAIHRRRFLCHVRDYYILRTLLETGLRVFELTALRVCDFRDNSIVVQRGKNGKKRTVLLALMTAKMLKQLLRLKERVLCESTDENARLFLSERGKPYTTRGIRKRVKLWFRHCGFSPKLSCHSCRHTYISHLLSMGVDLPLIRDNAGHSSLAVTSIYSHAVKDDLGNIDIYDSDSSEFRRKRNCSDVSEKKP